MKLIQLISQLAFKVFVFGANWSNLILIVDVHFGTLQKKKEKKRPSKAVTLLHI